MKAMLISIVNDTDTRLGRAFEVIIQALIFISVISFSIETLPDISSNTRDILFIIELICVAIFTVEYLLRIYVAEKILDFVFSFGGIIDLLAILPFYLMIGLDLRSLRGFRLLRILKVLNLARYSSAFSRFNRAFLIAKEELMLFMFTSLIVIYIAAVGIYYFENPVQPQIFTSIFHSLWWAVITLTTVGYGDAYPVTVGGKIFTFIMLIIGLGIVSVPAGIISSALSKARELE
ncbi:ion transporter [Vibrio sp.]|nr:ion transporter [Vibrio sp.]